MIIGIGTDLLHASQINDRYLEPGDPFFKKTFTEAEAQEAASRDDGNRFLRGRFAAKEAVFKALNLKSDDVPHWNLIEIICAENGAPMVVLHEEVAVKAELNGIKKVHVSLSNDLDCFLAFCVVTD